MSVMSKSVECDTTVGYMSDSVPHTEIKDHKKDQRFIFNVFLHSSDPVSKSAVSKINSKEKKPRVGKVRIGF